MNTTMVIVAIAAILLIVLVIAALMRARGGRLKPLPAGARERYAASWRAIETRFVDSPQEAVREADELVTSLARERGAKPEHVSGARKEISSESGQSMTENLRRAMVEYRATVEKLLGDDPRRVRGQREVAS